MEWNGSLYERHLRTRRFGRELEVLDEVDSTNRWMREHAERFTMSGGAVVAGHQTQGRGRQGRAWFDRPGESLLFSVLLRYSGSRESAGFLGLLAGIASARVLRARLNGRCAVNLKWPNDVLLNGRKVGGVLTETANGASVLTVVAGVGLNVTTARDELPEELRATATSVLSESGMTLAREALLAEILTGWEALFDDLLEGRVWTLSEAWESLGPEKGTVIERVAGGPRVRGAFEGIGPSGQLRLRDENGRICEIHSGETEAI